MKSVAQWRASKEYKNNYLQRKSTEQGLAEIVEPISDEAAPQSV